MSLLDCGCSIRNGAFPHGTGGCLVNFADSPQRVMLLTAGHALVPSTARQNDSIFSLDPNKPLGRLRTWSDLSGATTVDAALVWVDPAQISPAIAGLGKKPAGLNLEPQPGQTVFLYPLGGNGARRETKIDRLNFDIPMTVWDQDFRYTGQILCKSGDANNASVSDGGDSGAMVFDTNDNIVGMLVGGSRLFGDLVTPIGAILNYRGWNGTASLVTDMPPDAVGPDMAGPGALPLVPQGPGPAPTDPFIGSGSPITQQGFSNFLSTTGVSAPALWSVLSVETSGFGYIADRRPKILFERHVFSKLTYRKYDDAYPDISNPVSGGYGEPGANQYVRLGRAIQLDRSAALQSASWGVGQVLGRNATDLGYADVEAFVASMVSNEDNQLTAMLRFLQKNRAIAPLIRQDWAGFAKIYNGPDYAEHNYDGLLAQFFDKFRTGTMPDLQVRAAQIYLTFKGFKPGPVDGINGNGTKQAVKDFQESLGIAKTGVIDDALLGKLAS